MTSYAAATRRALATAESLAGEAHAILDHTPDSALSAALGTARDVLRGIRPHYEGTRSYDQPEPVQARDLQRAAAAAATLAGELAEAEQRIEAPGSTPPPTLSWAEMQAAIARAGGR
jgi:hypothetical protein